MIKVVQILEDSFSDGVFDMTNSYHYRGKNIIINLFSSLKDKDVDKLLLNNLNVNLIFENLLNSIEYFNNKPLIFKVPFKKLIIVIEVIEKYTGYYTADIKEVLN